MTVDKVDDIENDSILVLLRAEDSDELLRMSVYADVSIILWKKTSVFIMSVHKHKRNNN